MKTDLIRFFNRRTPALRSVSDLPEGMLETRGLPLCLGTQSRKASLTHDASIENLLGARCAGMGTEDARMKVPRNWAVENKYVAYFELRAIERDVTAEGMSSPCTKQLEGSLALGAPVGACSLSYAFPLLHPRLTEHFASAVLIRKSAFLTSCPGYLLVSSA